MRAWPWAAAGALLLVTAVSCLNRSPSHRANAQPQTTAPAPEQPPAGGEAAPAAGAKPAPAGEQAPEKTTHEVILDHADRVRYDNKTKDYTLTGDIVLRHEDGVLRAQTLRMNSETKKGVATGDLSFADKQTTVTANRLEIDFDARVALFKDDVRLVTQKKPEPGEAKTEAGESANGAAAATAEAAPAEPAEGKTEGPPAEPAKGSGDGEEAKPFREYWKDRTEIRCPELLYYYRDDRAVARGGITARQKDQRGRADEAVYTDKDELLVLSGNVEMENDRGETFRARKVTVSIAEDWLEAEGISDSRFLVEEEKEEAPAQQAAPTAETPGAPPAEGAAPGPKP